MAEAVEILKRWLFMHMCVCVCLCKGSVLYEQLCRNVKQIEKQKGQHLKHKYTQSKIRTYIHMYIPTSRQAAFILQIY